MPDCDATKVTSVQELKSFVLIKNQPKQTLPQKPTENVTKSQMLTPLKMQPLVNKPASVVTQRAKRKRDQLSPVVENDDASESLVNSIVDSLVPAFLHAFKDKLASDANLTVNNHNAIAVETNNTFHSNANVEAT